MSARGTAVVTGASSGIGAAAVRQLAAVGYDVVAGARRVDRLEQLAAEVPGVRVVALDVTDEASVSELARSLDDPDGIALLVANAGGAFGADEVEDASPDDWAAMFDVNVLGVLRVVQALLPALEAGGGGGIVVTGSTAGGVVYEGGGGYTAAKHAVHALVGTLRLELAGRPVRVSEVQPGMVATDEFSVKRYRGDEQAAAGVYAGVDSPLTADDVADCITWIATRPRHVDVDLLVVRPLAQAAQHKVVREPIWGD